MTDLDQNRGLCVSQTRSIPQFQQGRGDLKTGHTRVGLRVTVAVDLSYCQIRYFRCHFISFWHKSCPMHAYAKATSPRTSCQTIRELFTALAKITPLCKKVPLVDPNSYRMLTVSGNRYRLYANAICSLFTTWCISKGKSSDTQSEFLPRLEHSATHVHPEAPAASCQHHQAQQLVQAAYSLYWLQTGLWHYPQKGSLVSLLRHTHA